MKKILAEAPQWSSQKGTALQWKRAGIWGHFFLLLVLFFTRTLRGT